MSHEDFPRELLQVKVSWWRHPDVMIGPQALSEVKSYVTVALAVTAPVMNNAGLV